MNNEQHAAAVSAGAAAAAAGGRVTQAQAHSTSLKWYWEADVVVIGSGAAGLPAAIVAREAGATAIVVEAQKDIGGHAVTSGGNVPLGGGTSTQKKHGIEDSPDLLFRDLTDWSVVQPNGFPDYRYNDREIVRAFADNSAPAYEWLLAHGVVFVDKAPDALGGNGVGNSVPREMHAAAMDWRLVQTGERADPAIAATRSTGNGLMRPLEVAAKEAGVQILLQHRMTAIHREAPGSGRVLGVAVDNNGTTLNIRARRAVVVATGGHTGNVNFRRMFDPRLTEEYCGLAGMPWSDQDASGEIAAMAVGASLWGLFNQTGEFGIHLTKPGAIGCQYNYRNLRWMPGSAVFERARATGLAVADWQDAILVNMLGRRFYDETAGNFTGNNYDFDQALCPRQLSERRRHRLQAQQLDQRRARRYWRRTQWRRPDLGDFRCGGGGPRSMEPGAAECRHRRRLFLQRRHARRAGEEDRHDASARPDAARNSGKHRRPLQFLCRFGR